MPFFTQLLVGGGAEVELVVGVHEARSEMLKKHQFPIPARKRLRVQIDTGSSFTAVDQEIFQGLGIGPLDFVEVKVISPNGSTIETFPRYAVSLGLEGNGVELHLPDVQILGCHMTLENDGVLGVLGRDVLTHCFFLYDGSEGRFTLGF